MHIFRGQWKRILGTAYGVNFKPFVTATVRSYATIKDKRRSLPKIPTTEKTDTVKMANNAISYFKTAEKVFKIVSLLPALVKTVAAGVVLVAAVRVIMITNSNIEDIRESFSAMRNGINGYFESFGAGCKGICDTASAVNDGICDTIEKGMNGKLKIVPDVFLRMYGKLTTITIRDILHYPFRGNKDMGAIEDAKKVGYLEDARKKFNDKLAFLGIGHKYEKDPVEKKAESDQITDVTGSYTERWSSLRNKYLPINMSGKEKKEGKEDEK